MCSYSDIDDLAQIFSSLAFEHGETEPIQKNPQLLLDLLASSETTPFFTWESKDYKHTVYKFVTLDTCSSEYCLVKAGFDRTMRKHYTVCKIDKIENPYLYAQYCLRKLQKGKIYSRLIEMTLYHGTKKANIPSICTNNFDYRLSGTSVGHKFGKGISFSPTATYSCHYPRSYEVSPRVMILSDVLVGKICNGTQLMRIPPNLFDTSQKPDGQVIVKYDNIDIYPKYVIYYS